MKNLFSIIAVLFTLNISAQSIVSIIPKDINKYVVTYVDSLETEFDGVVIPRYSVYEVSDTSNVKDVLLEVLREKVATRRSAMQQAFSTARFRQELIELRTEYANYDTINMILSLSNQFAPQLVGKKLRFFNDETQSFLGTIIQLPSGALRLENDATSDRYTLIPYMGDYWEIRNIPYLDDGTTGTFSFLLETVRDGRLIYRPEEYSSLSLRRLKLVERE